MIKAYILVGSMVLAAAFGVVMAVDHTSPHFPGAENMHVRYEFYVENKSSAPLESVVLNLFSPRFSAFGQRLASYSVYPSSDERVVVDSKASRIELSIARLSPFQGLPVSIGAEVNITGQVDNDSLNVFAKRPDSVPNEIADISLSLEGDYPSLVMQWLKQNIRASHYRPRLRSSTDILLSGNGDCTDFSVVASELLWARNIPNVVVGGFIVQGKSELLTAANYHNWLYLNYDGQWILMDPINGLLSGNADHYLVFEYLDSGLQKSRFYANNNNVSVVMK